jgi:hypothetical protein
MEKINIPHDLCHISHQLSRLGKFVFHLSSDIRCIDEINIVENSVLDRTGGTILKREDYKIRFILVDVWHGCFLTYYYRYTTGQVLLCFLPADTMPISDYRSNLPFQFCNVWWFYAVSLHCTIQCNLLWVRVMVFDDTFNNISVISWQSVLLVKETYRIPPISHWQISHYVSSTPRHQQNPDLR